MSRKGTTFQLYLETCLRLTRLFLASLDEDPVPVWDFRLEPGSEPIRDSSAAAIAVCAIQELQSLESADRNMLQMKQALLERLCSPDDLDTAAGCGGILKHGQVGDGIGRARRTYASWGDYFFMQALGRELGLEVSWW